MREKHLVPYKTKKKKKKTSHSHHKSLTQKPKAAQWRRARIHSLFSRDAIFVAPYRARWEITNDCTTCSAQSSSAIYLVSNSKHLSTTLFFLIIITTTSRFFFSPPSRFFHSTHRWSACWASAYSRSPLKSWMKWCVALWVVEKKSHNSRPDTEIESVFCPLACFFFFSYTERDYWVLSTV